ncbi:uncharacterized protein A1O5_09153 [Cladophialophora psammophila CBS 110553]|uniref:Uncharacterized protein n=1 Tax=Cladophialophora psammophila CBS 110553 TaxID=1182543 RepID=W9WI64_9EURO|nr:uncharacterized protein A1O5_09153 [Cladophialophora psammophila CBS 110553]EXJ67807.1 hypothetical protein A1O5_09153 [Cladophialophora psammophila CBS 110553]
MSFMSRSPRARFDPYGCSSSSEHGHYYAQRKPAYSGPWSTLPDRLKRSYYMEHARRRESQMADILRHACLFQTPEGQKNYLSVLPMQILHRIIKHLCQGEKIEVRGDVTDTDSASHGRVAEANKAAFMATCWKSYYIARPTFYWEVKFIFRTPEALHTFTVVETTADKERLDFVRNVEIGPLALPAWEGKSDSFGNLRARGFIGDDNFASGYEADVEDNEDSHHEE